MLILLSIPESILPPLHYSAALSIPERPPLLPPPRCTDLSILRVRPESCLYSPYLRASFLSPTQTTCSDHLIVNLRCAPFLHWPELWHPISCPYLQLNLRALQINFKHSSVLDTHLQMSLKLLPYDCLSNMLLHQLYPLPWTYKGALIQTINSQVHHHHIQLSGQSPIPTFVQPFDTSKHWQITGFLTVQPILPLNHIVVATINQIHPLWPLVNQPVFQNHTRPTNQNLQLCQLPKKSLIPKEPPVLIQRFAMS